MAETVLGALLKQNETNVERARAAELELLAQAKQALSSAMVSEARASATKTLPNRRVHVMLTMVRKQLEVWCAAVVVNPKSSL